MGTITRSDVGASRQEIEELIEQKLMAKIDRFIKDDKEFKQKLILLLSQMRESQQVSQEGFDKLDAFIRDQYEGAKADLNSF